MTSFETSAGAPTTTAEERLARAALPDAPLAMPDQVLAPRPFAETLARLSQLPGRRAEP
ncbi:MAG: hypothetical protein KDE00_10775 [Rhodobacteraceae bacterium]|nr:hypothetical protein [Paracoccaceae bacterium]